MPPARATGPSLAPRAFLAVALTVAFYALAVGLALLLLRFAWWELTDARRLDVRLVLFAVVGGVVILWSILPRFERFVPPGPRLSARGQPRLFEVLREVARETGQPMPADVYLVPDINAGVLERGGWLGFGGRRMMVLGLPLLAALRVSELRAVLAHEFGHYAGGETRLGPWIYRTREAIGRTVQSLGEVSSLLSIVFVGYGRLFLLITQAISRRQELAADRLAAGVAGEAALAAGLRRVHGADPAFRAYFAQEVGPVLDSGFRPPLAEGFLKFLRTENVSTAVDGLVERMARTRKGDRYDTHPPLGERLAALGDPGPEEPGPGNPRALALLEDLDGLERALLGGVLPDMPPDVPRLSWEEAGPKVYLPAWRKAVAGGKEHLGEVTVGGLGEALAPPPEVRRRVRLMAGGGEPPRRNAKLEQVGACAVALLLSDRGWTLDCEPGAPVSLARDGVAFRPFEEADALAAGRAEPSDWEVRVRGFGIADVRLADAAPTPGRPPSRRRGA